MQYRRWVLTGTCLLIIDLETITECIRRQKNTTPFDSVDTTMKTSHHTTSREMKITDKTKNNQEQEHDDEVQQTGRQDDRLGNKQEHGDKEIGLLTLNLTLYFTMHWQRQTFRIQWLAMEGLV
jgi:hypothetical protein